MNKYGIPIYVKHIRPFMVMRNHLFSFRMNVKNRFGMCLSKTIGING